MLDQAALVVLGKALFWDMQAGSVGRTACATGHFHAGADHRAQHQLSGPDAVMNRALTSLDFPFRKLSNTGNNRSAVVSDTRQVHRLYGCRCQSFRPGGARQRYGCIQFCGLSFALHAERCPFATGHGAQLAVGDQCGLQRQELLGWTRSNIFTGATPFGESDSGLHALVYRDGKLEREAVRMENASLASQAVGPVLNPVEMSWAGRSWRELGRKLFSLPPLARQRVSPTDSVLGAAANPDGNGLQPEWSYGALIQAAFHREYYSSPELIDGYTQAENNFALVWGLAIQAYEPTLIANASRVDQFLERRAEALTAMEQQGLNEFRAGGSQCINCHNGAELTAAGWSVVQRRGGVGVPANLGFFRIGVRPIGDDIGFGGNDDFGLPIFSPAPGSAAGTFKAPSLRNVEFTGPYFHDGSQDVGSGAAVLRQRRRFS